LEAVFSTAASLKHQGFLRLCLESLAQQSCQRILFLEDIAWRKSFIFLLSVKWEGVLRQNRSILFIVTPLICRLMVLLSLSLVFPFRNHGFPDVETLPFLNQIMTRDGRCVLLAPAGQSVVEIIQLYECVVIEQESTTPESLTNLVISCSQWQEEKNAGNGVGISNSILYDLFSPVLLNYGLKLTSTLKEGLMIIYGIVCQHIANKWRLSPRLRLSFFN
jgi:hypothetical protein